MDEKLLGQMQSDVEHIKGGQDDLKKTIDKIFGMLDGKDGLVATVEVHESRLNTMPTPKSTSFIAAAWGGITGAIIVLAKLIFFGSKS